MDMTLEEFVNKYKDYAKIISSNYFSQVFDYGIDLEDLYQVGLLALVECYDKYDPSRSSTSTFAYLSIKHSIYKYVQVDRCVTYIPAGLQVISHVFTKKKLEFYLVNGRNMTYDEMLSFLENECNTSSYLVDEKFVDLLLKIETYHLSNRRYSLEDKIENYDTSSFSYHEDKGDVYIKDIIASDFDLEEEVIRNIEAEKYLNYVNSNIEGVSLEIFKEVLGLNDGVPKTRKEIGKMLGIKHYQDVSQRYDRVLKKIRKNFNIYE